MATCPAIIEFIQTHKVGIALFFSTIIGLGVMFVWTALWHWYANWCDRRAGLGISLGERDLPTVIIGGAVERGLVTALVLWLPSEVGVIVAGLITVKAIGSWGQVSLATLSGRRRYYAHFMGSLGSMFWALAWGIWAMPPHS